MKTHAAAALLAVAVLAGCATANPDVIHRGDTQRMATVQDGTVLSIRPVVIESQPTGVGTAAGGVIGGVAGSSIGSGSGRDSIVGGVIGAVVGGIVGHAVERSATREDAVEIIVQLRNGERRALVQAQGAEPLAPGDAVVIVTTGGRTRVTRAPAPAAYPVPRS